MSRESRIIRPYRGVDRFQGILDDLYVEFGDRQIFAGGLATTSSVDFVTACASRARRGRNQEDQVATAINAACQKPISHRKTLTCSLSCEHPASSSRKSYGESVLTRSATARFALISSAATGYAHSKPQWRVSSTRTSLPEMLNNVPLRLWRKGT